MPAWCAYRREQAGRLEQLYVFKTPGPGIFHGTSAIRLGSAADDPAVPCRLTGGVDHLPAHRDQRRVHFHLILAEKYKRGFQFRS